MAIIEIKDNFLGRDISYENKYIRNVVSNKKIIKKTDDFLFYAVNDIFENNDGTKNSDFCLGVKYLDKGIHNIIGNIPKRILKSVGLIKNEYKKVLEKGNPSFYLTKEEFTDLLDFLKEEIGISEKNKTSVENNFNKLNKENKVFLGGEEGERTLILGCNGCLIYTHGLMISKFKEEESYEIQFINLYKYDGEILLSKEQLEIIVYYMQN